LAIEATMMAARLYNTERWTEADDRLLRTMSETGKSLTLMTARLKRPMTAIKARAEDLGIGIAGTDIGKRKRREIGVSAKTFTGHSCSALTAQFIGPRALGMVLTDPADAETDLAVRVDHETRLTG